MSGAQITDTVQANTITNRAGTGAPNINGGTTTPAAGFIGEKLTASVSNGGTVSSPISNSNAATLSLTAGNWMVYGKWYIETITGTMVVTSIQASLSSTSATPNAVSTNRITATFSAGDQEIVAGPIYVSQASTANVYLVVSATWTGAGTSRINAGNTALYAVRMP